MIFVLCLRRKNVVRAWHSPAPWMEHLPPTTGIREMLMEKGRKRLHFLFFKKVSGSLENELWASDTMSCGLLYHIWLLWSSCQQQSRNTLIVAMQDNTIIHFYILNVSGLPSPHSGVKCTTVETGWHSALSLFFETKRRRRSKTPAVPEAGAIWQYIHSS